MTQLIIVPYAFHQPTADEMQCYDYPVNSGLPFEDFLFGAEPVVLILTVFTTAPYIQFIRPLSYRDLR
jgi:hypothetical protein